MNLLDIPLYILYDTIGKRRPESPMEEFVMIVSGLSGFKLIEFSYY